MQTENSLPSDTNGASHSDPESTSDLLAQRRQIFWKRVRGHVGLQIGAGIIFTLLLIALFAPWLAPHDPYVQSLTHRLLPPVWSEGG